ncbi:MAG: hypothetical protein AAGG07_14255 [Planctomycetota bacterium]
MLEDVAGAVLEDAAGIGVVDDVDVVDRVEACAGVASSGREIGPSWPDDLTSAS